MILFVGPRLDRPSAVGDEGRPRDVGLAAATVAVLLYAGGIAEVLDLWRPLRLVALGVGLHVAGLALVGREDPVSPFAGHLLFLPGGLIAIGGVLASVLAGPAVALLVAGLALALFGVAGAWADAVGRGGVTTAIEGGAVSVVVLLLAAIAVPATVGAATLLWAALEPALLPGPAPGFPGLLFVVGAAALAIRVALPRLPIVELAARDRRPALERRRATAARLAAVVGIAAIVGWIVLGLGEVAGLVPSLAELVGRSPLVTVAAGAPLRLALALVATAALIGTVAAGLGRRVAGMDPTTARGLAPVVGGLGLVSIPVPVLVWVVYGVVGGSWGLLLVAAVVLVLVLLGAVAVLLGLALLAVAAGAGLLPDRAAPLALVGVGLLGTTVGLGVGGAPAPFVFAGVAAATFAWDVSEFGLGLTAELGHLPDTTRVELLHAVAAAGVAVVGVALAAGLHAGVRAVGSGTPALAPATVLAFLGSLALFAAIRG